MTDIILSTDNTEYRQFVEFALRTLQGAKSQRIYDQTYRAWDSWCKSNAVEALDLRPGNVLDFLTSKDTAKATRVRQLSALRKLAQVIYVMHPHDANRQIVEALKLIKAPAPEQRTERRKTALTPAQADKLLRYWSDDSSLIGLRNNAIIAVLLLTGIRRDEACKLKWEDVDFENGVISVRHGKGDKAREVSVAGDAALDALRAWHMQQPGGRVWVFVGVRKGNHLGQDKPLSGNDIWLVVGKTSLLAGLPHEIKPHDLRRTLITELLATGMPIHDVQTNAGHTKGDTTLKYAQSVSARERRNKMKLRYGG